MAKGRKLTISRSERFLGTSYGYSHSQVTAGTGESELGEEDVWSMVDGMVDREREDSSSAEDSRGGSWTPSAGASYGGHCQSSIKSRRHAGGLSLAVDDSPTIETTSSSKIVHKFRSHDGVAQPRGRHMAASAPVKVQDWSKIFRVDSVESMHDSDEGSDDRESEMIPPHEYLAREYSRNSVFEGVGRTLKGRDLRRVRDAVWSQTGFDG